MYDVRQCEGQSPVKAQSPAFICSVSWFIMSASADSEHEGERSGVLVYVYRYVVGELFRGYLVERDEAMFSEKQRRVNTFMKTPRELEKLMLFGILICLDAYLFTFTFLPVRVLISLIRFLYRICQSTILVLCMLGMSYVDTSAIYHIVRGQSVIKLYVIYNMLEIFDRLLASIGQDSLDSLFWSAAVVEGKEGREGRRNGRDYTGAAFYYIVATGYVFIHTIVLLIQTVTLNVAVNSHSKALLTIMVSNNFVELKGSVFKKFEKNNLFQMSCSDIRERFHYVILLMLVSIRNLAQLNWDTSYLEQLIPIIALVLISELFVDWTKHAFITKFNDISPDVYHEYRAILAKDLASSQHQQAKSDHSDLVSRRMGFIPLPLTCLVWRTLSQSFTFPGLRGAALLTAIYLCLTAVKVIVGILLLGRASHYCTDKKTTTTRSSNESSPASCSSSGDTGINVGSHIIGGVAAGLTQRTNSSVHKSTTTDYRKQRSLSEVERYTLVNNRIV